MDKTVTGNIEDKKNAEKTEISNFYLNTEDIATLKNTPLYLNLSDFSKDKLIFEGYIKTNYKNDMKIFVVNTTTSNRIECEQIDTTKYEDYMDLDYVNSFHVEIPIDSDFFNFYFTIEVNNPNYKFNPKISFNKDSLLNNRCNNISKYNHVLTFNKNQFKYYEKEYRVSIIIPSQNPINLRSQLNSIFDNNLSDNYQVILVDYDSKQISEIVASEYSKLFSEKFIYIRQDECDLNKAIIRGLEYSNGTYISVFDFNDNFNDFNNKSINEYIKSNEDFFYYNSNERENNGINTQKYNLCNLFVKKEYLESIIRNNPSLNIADYLEDELNKVNENPKLNEEIIILSNQISNHLSEVDKENIPAFVEDSIIDKLEYILNNLNFNHLTEEEKEAFSKNFYDITSFLNINLLENKISKRNLTLLMFLINEKVLLDTHESYSTLLSNYDSVYEILNNNININYMYIDYDNLYIRGKYYHDLIDEVQINLIKDNDDTRVIPAFCSQHVNGVPKDNYSNFEVTVPLTRFENCKLHFEITIGKKLFKPNITYYNTNEGRFKNYISDYYHVSKKESCLNITRGYNFSIVMAIYNTENYLEQTIDSVINQSIGFEDNVQLILVDDGSEDNSKEICLDYMEKYPDNIVLLEQENSGQATARNNGLKYVKGKYVNFLDSDDYLSSNTLENVNNFFKTCENIVDVVAIPIKFFGRKDDYHMLHNKFKKSGIIDLIKKPNNPQLSSSSAFINSYLFEKYSFPTNVVSSEDTIVLNKIILETKKYGIITDATYHYRKRFDESSTIDSVSKKKEFFIDKLKYYFLELINYSLKVEKEVPQFIKYLIAYDIQWLIKEPDLDILTDDEQKEFYRYLYEVLKYLDKDCIINNPYVTNQNFKSFFMSLKNEDIHYEIETDNVLKKSSDYTIDQLKTHNIWMDIVEIDNDTLYLSGFINSNFKIEELSINAEKEVNGDVSLIKGKYVKYTSREDITFLSQKWQYKHSFDIQIPLVNGENNNIKILCMFHENGNQKESLVSCYLTMKFGKHAKISSVSNYIVKDDYIMIFENNTFKIYKYSYSRMRKFEKNVQKRILSKKYYNYNEALSIRKKYLRYYPLIRLYKRFRQIHIYMDRLDVADDNSEHLFRYANKQHDNVKKFYVLSDQSPDFDRVSQYGKVIPYKSRKNKFLYLIADKVISTHPYESGINPFFSYNRKTDERENYSGLINSKIYFLQHGVTKDDISDWMSKYDKNLSLLVTVSDKERESFYVEGYGYDKDIIQTLGFPRYDNLKNNSNKQILIIPTWRKYLRGNKKLFVNSDYFNNLNNLLNNEEFINYAKEKGYKIVFKAHPELEKPINDTDELYIDLFEIDDYVKLSTEESYQELFNNSSLLITDYSSVFFDFAYQKKPVVYYHPSDDYHYQEGYFNYESMGFGEIIEDENSLVKTIKDYMDNDCQMKEEFVERVNNFFKYTDKNNSKRVYDWIKKH